jgi:hypothetical protein
LRDGRGCFEVVTDAVEAPPVDKMIHTAPRAKRADQVMTKQTHRALIRD